MARLAEDLLQMARLEAKADLPLKPLDLPLLLQAMEPTFTAIDPERPFQVEIEGSATVLGNADGLKQILWNLVENARRYSPAHTPIRITCRAEGSVVRLAVSDLGAGIAPEDLPRLFDRFWRGDKSRTRETGGAGLGLSIVKALVESHGGEIGVESVLGKGTTFTIQLPLAAE